MRKIDIAVVGAGPAGIGAALSAACNGASVAMIDENVAPGGHLRWTMRQQTGFGGSLDGLRGFEIADWAVDALATAQVQVLTSSVSWGLFEDNVLGVTTASESFQLQATSVIIATGATDAVWPFPGWELPGVMTATAALKLMHLERVLPGQRVVVLGAGHYADDIASDLSACGAIVALRLVSGEGIVAGGPDTVAWVEADGNRTECDAVVLAFGRQPDPHLALQAQTALAYSPHDMLFVPSRDAALATSLPGVYVVGHAAGVGSAARAFAEGTVAGESASDGNGLSVALERLRSFEPVTASQSAMSVISDKTIVCRCEEIGAGMIRRAIADGSSSLNDIKRRTRAGMGICQGVYCNRTMAGMLAADSGIALESIVPMTARPPARLISMAAMAGFES